MSLQGARAAQEKRERTKFKQEYEAEARRPIDQQVAANCRLISTLAEKRRDTLYSIQDEELLTSLPKYSGNLTPEQAELAVRAAFDQFTARLAQQGVTFTQEGVQCFQRLSFLYSPAIDVTNPEAFRMLYEYCESIGAFTDAERTKPAPKVTPTPAPSAPVDIENLELTSREGATAGRQWALEGLVEEAAALYRVFKQHLRDVWSVEISKEDGDACVQYIRNSGLNLCDKRSWDAARKNVLHLLTPDEKLCADIEATSTSLDQYSVRRDFRKRQHEALQ